MACRNCGCADCLAVRVARHRGRVACDKQRSLRKRADRRCDRCGGPNPLFPKWFCPACAAKRNDIRRVLMHQVRAQRVGKKLCVTCGRNPVDSRYVTCLDCRMYGAEARRKRQRKQRAAA